MSQSKLRSNQLNVIKIKLLLKDCLLIFFTYGLVLALLIIELVEYIKYLNGGSFLKAYFEQNILFVIVTIILILLCIPYYILLSKIFKKDDHQFHQKYLEYLFAECELNDIKYKYRKKNYDPTLNEEYEPQFNVKKIEYLYSLSDINSTRVFDYMQVSYIKDGEKKFGVLESFKIDAYLDGFLQIRTQGEPLVNAFEDKKIQRFGFSYIKEKGKYEIYSSLGSRTYVLDNPKFSELLSKISGYLKTNFIITFNHSLLSLFIEDFQFNLTTGYFKFKQEDFDRRINSLIHLHELSNELISTLTSFKG